MADDRTTNKPPPILYHYTDARGFLGISREKALWATNIRHLNDSTEYLHTLDLVRLERDGRLSSLTIQEQAFLSQLLAEGMIHEVLRTRRQGSPYFVVSLTSEPDLLSQWRAYAPRNGYSLGWPTEDLQALASQNGFKLCQCIYDETEQRRRVAELVDDTLAVFRREPFNPTPPERDRNIEVRMNKLMNDFDDAVGAVATVCKNPVFSEEREWRLVSPRTRWSGSGCEFREARGRLIPFVRFKLERNPLPPSQQLLPMISVITGPNPDPDLAQETALYLLSNEHWQGIGVGKSAIPYRDW